MTKNWLVHLKKWSKKYYLWFFLLVCVLLITILLVINFNQKPDPVGYEQLKPYNIVAGPPENQFNKPTAVAVGLKGELYIIDSGNQRIIVLEEDGRYSAKFGGPGSGRAELVNPVSIDISPNGTVYVADRGKEAVIVYNGDGSYLYTIGEEPAGSFKPLSVQIDNKGNAYIFDTVSRKFRVYNSHGKKISDFISKAMGSFENITALDMDPEEGKVYGLDSGKRNYFESTGTATKFLGEDRLVEPQGLIYNRSKQLVLISDSYKNKIIIFGKDGNYLGEFGGTGDGMTNFKNPAGLAFDEQGKLYIADKDNNRVVIYTY